MSGYIAPQLIGAVRARAEDLCEYCRLPQASQEAIFHVDHIHPRSAGGETTDENLALACVSCSLRKSARTQARDPLTNRMVALFHPRRQKWPEHFRWTTNWRIVGRTSVGRATVVALNMNRAAIVAIRVELAKGKSL